VKVLNVLVIGRLEIRMAVNRCKAINHEQEGTGTFTRWVMTSVLLPTMEATRNLKLQ
jgi:hypothetical protein